MKTKEKYLPIITLILGLILGSILIALTDFRIGVISASEAGEKVKEAYELTTGASVNIVGVLKESGMYKVIARVTDLLGQTSVLEVYVSQDGKLLSQNAVKLDELVASLERQRIFIDCLDQKGLKIYGIANNTATQLQLQVLGGSRFLGEIYVNCVDQTLQQCLDAGILTVPSIAYKGEVYEGIKNIEWFEENTGCELERE
jgi:hypothetical protein